MFRVLILKPVFISHETYQARYGPFTGQYVLHCHILEHEDHDMMRPYNIISEKK